jgi:6-pyruvoyltetrahydropterin/6-carboxytetrahydropterin synthase
MSISITRIFFFESAHYLPDHEHKCKNLHGHSYKLEVTVEGDLSSSGSSNGMVMDFGRLKKIVQQQIVDRLDHTLLNDSLPSAFHPPTAENMCRYAAQQLQAMGVNVTHIRLWETAASHADWRLR